MIYISDNDLFADAKERFIDESTADNTESKDKIEERVIGIVKDKISGRFDVDKIFDPDEPIRSELLVDIISKMVLYRIYRRNSGRKMSEDTAKDNDWANTELDKINAGKTPLNGLPKKAVDTTSEPGRVDSDTLWGNFSDPNFYI